MARTAIKKLIAQMDFLHLIKECSSSVDAFDYLRSNLVDLVFLDVEMPGMTGIELLRNLHKRPIVILVTAKRNYAVEAYELDVADYIVKPVSMSRFAKAVYEARDLWDKKQKEEANEGRDYIFVRSNSILTKVKATGSM
jgi:two-component SAPR family response regulator